MLDENECLCSHLDLSNPLQAMLRAVLMIAFQGFARLGEVTTQWQDKVFNQNNHISIDLVSQKTDRISQAEVTVIAVPSTRSSPVGGEKLLFASQRGPADTSKALKVHKQVNQPKQGEYLLLYNYMANGVTKWCVLLRRTFKVYIKAACKVTGIEYKPLYGLRIGGMLEYLLHGLSFK